MNVIRKIFFMLPFLLMSSFAISQGIINNGANFYVESGAFIYGGTFTNQTNVTDGAIKLDGTMILEGDFLNNAAGNNVFLNIEPVPNGSVLLNGTLPQSIGGSTPTHFENLGISNATKILNINDCEVKGIFEVGAVLDLNHYKFIIDNPNTTAINYSAGYILSETQPATGLGDLQWNIGSSLGTYQVPFGSGAGGRDLNLALTTTTAASPSMGNFIFATYPTDAMNLPYPAPVLSLDVKLPEKIADRYWKIEPNYTVKPDVDITFGYALNDVDQIDNPGLKEDLLQAMRYNESSNTWLDMEPSGTANVASQSISCTGIKSYDLYKWWALTEMNESSIIIPNVMTPNGDGFNDFFHVQTTSIENLDGQIFNRWGRLLFEWSGVDIKWDGTYDGKLVSDGTYFYIITAKGYDKKEYHYTGTLTIIK